MAEQRPGPRVGDPAGAAYPRSDFGSAASSCGPDDVRRTSRACSAARAIPSETKSRKRATPSRRAAAKVPAPTYIVPGILMVTIGSTVIGAAVSVSTDMAEGIRPIAEYQPFTPVIETLRGLLLGTEIGHNGWLAVGWSLALAVLGYLWSKSLFRRDPAAR